MHGYYPYNNKETEMRIIMQAKTERFEARLNVEQKELFVRAAALQGVTLSDFIVNSAQVAAKQTMQEEQLMSLTLRDRLAFVEALLDDSPPNPKLQKAAKNYKNKMNLP